MAWDNEATARDNEATAGDPTLSNVFVGLLIEDDQLELGSSRPASGRVCVWDIQVDRNAVYHLVAVASGEDQQVPEGHSIECE